MGGGIGGRRGKRRRPAVEGIADGGEVGPAHRNLARQHRGGMVAQPHAGGLDHRRRPLQPVLQFGVQPAGAAHGTTGAVAHPHGGGGRRLALPQQAEMGVKAGGLPDFRRRQAEIRRQPGQMGGIEAAMAVLQPVQVFDQLVPRGQLVTSGHGASGNPYCGLGTKGGSRPNSDSSMTNSASV